jgi:hypothetical protein
MVIIGLILLGSSLSSIELKSGIPLPRIESTQMINTSGYEGSEPPASENIPSKEQANSKPFIIATLLLGILILGILIYSGLKNKENAKIFLVLSAIIATFMLLIFILGTTSGGIPEILPTEINEPVQPLPSINNSSPVGNPPDSLFWIVKIILFLGVVLLMFAMVYLLQHRKQTDFSVSAEAGSALHALKQGDDLDNVIITCYLNLLKLAQDRQGVEREEHVTPREFEVLLTSLGIPSTPIHQLTQLFEKVRYGKKAIDSNDEYLAIDCLTAIQKSNSPKNQVKK